jgi:hypothetical protein
VARSNLHAQASQLLANLSNAAADGRFEGALKEIASASGLNPARSAEALKLLESIGRIEVIQRGRRDRLTIVAIRSTEPVTPAEAGSARSASSERKPRLDHTNIGKAVVDRLLELGRDDALRAAQTEAFEREAKSARERVLELEAGLAEANERENSLRVRLRAAEEALVRAEENLRAAMGEGRPPGEPSAIPDDEAKAVLDILRRA